MKGTVQTTQNEMTAFSGLGQALPQLRMTVDRLGPGDCHSAAVEWTKQAVLNTAFLDSFIMLLLMSYAYVCCPRTTLLLDAGGWPDFCSLFQASSLRLWRGATCPWFPQVVNEEPRLYLGQPQGAQPTFPHPARAKHTPPSGKCHQNVAEN